MLTAEQADYSARLNLITARAARFTDTVALFQALGGGWWNRTDVDTKIAQLLWSAAMNDFATLPRTTTPARRPRTWLRLTLMLLGVGSGGRRADLVPAFQEPAS